MDPAIQAALPVCGYDELRPQQLQILEGILSGRDCLLCAPTGSGKSLIFEVSPFALYNKENNIAESHGHYANCLTVVVSPLVALMRSQTPELNRRGIRTIYLGDANADVRASEEDEEVSLSTDQKLGWDELYAGHVHVLLASPESLLSKAGRNLLKRIGPQMVKCLVVDEAHCVKKYGHSSGKQRRAFRPQYRQLHQLRAILPGVPCVALTATANSATKSTIIKDLALVDCLQVNLSPHKSNIRYEVVKVGRATDFDLNFRFLVDLIKEKGGETPRMLIFFRQMTHLTGAYEFVDAELGKDAYTNFSSEGSNDDRNHLIEMYVMKTDEEVKSNIVKTFSDPNGHIRVVFCSSSFSMGLNLRDLDIIVHYGVPTDLDDYIQQTGRAGRDESHEAHAIIMYHSDALKGKNLQQSMKNVVKTTDCRRVVIYEEYVSDVAPVEPLHKCCDNCRKKCKCTENCDLGECELVTKLKADLQPAGSSTQSSESEHFSNSSSSSIELYRQRKPVALQYSSTDSD